VTQPSPPSANLTLPEYRTDLCPTMVQQAIAQGSVPDASIMLMTHVQEIGVRENWYHKLARK